MLGQMQVLWEEKGTYKERIRELGAPAVSGGVREAPQFGGVLSGHPTLARHGVTFCEAASGGQESDLAERLGYSLVDDVGDDVASIQSGASQWSVKQHCFMSDAIFKTCSGNTEYYLMGRDLKKGSQVMAGEWGDYPRSGCTPGDLPCHGSGQLASGWGDAARDPGPSRAGPRRKRRVGQDSLRPGGPAEGRRLGGARLGGSCRAHRGESPGDGVRGAEDRL